MLGSEERRRVAAGEIKRRREARSDFCCTVKSCWKTRDRFWCLDHFLEASSCLHFDYLWSLDRLEFSFKDQLQPPL